jgi:hypothetical protein
MAPASNKASKHNLSRVVTGLWSIIDQLLGGWMVERCLYTDNNHHITNNPA